MQTSDVDRGPVHTSWKRCLRAMVDQERHTREHAFQNFVLLLLLSMILSTGSISRGTRSRETPA